jgi:hypothetical protein
MLTPTTILATEAEVPATAVRRIRDSIRGVLEPATAVAGTVQVMDTEIDTIRTTKYEERVMASAAKLEVVAALQRANYQQSTEWNHSFKMVSPSMK